MATSEQIDWNTIHLSEDEASAEGTRAICFIVQQVERAQNNPFLKPMLNNLMMAHALKLLTYEPPAHISPPHEGISADERREISLPQENRGTLPQVEIFEGSSSSLSRHPR